MKKDKRIELRLTSDELKIIDEIKERLGKKTRSSAIRSALVDYHSLQSVIDIIRLKK